jgi:adenylate cyclase
MAGRGGAVRRRAEAWWQRHRRRLLQFWALGAVVSIGLTAVTAAGYLEGTKALSLDLLMRLRGPRLASDVVIVAIDDAAFEALGQRQPIPRDYLAKVVRGLQRGGAAVVGLDLALTAASSPAADAALARAVRDFADGGLSRVVLVAVEAPVSGPLSESGFWVSVVRGSPDLPDDLDGTTRRVAPLVPQEGRLAPAFGLAVAARLAGLNQPALERAVAAGKVPIARRQEGNGTASAAPIDLRPGDFWRINFVGPAQSFLTIPSSVVVALAEGGSEIAADNPLRGRVALIGATFRDSREFFDTPHGKLAGVEVHANIIHMLLTRTFIHPASWGVTLAIQLVLALGAGILMVTVRPMVATALILGLTPALGLAVSQLAFQRSSYWIDFSLPFIATRVLAVGTDWLERRRVRQAFGRYLSPHVAAAVLGDAPSLAGRRRQVSVLFSDLRGFTALAESMAPEEVAQRLDEYFEVMTRIIFRHGGMVNDFIGDAVMAVFGAPLGDRDHALHAAQAALAMEEGLQTLNARWAVAGLPPLRMGIGVHSGEVFAGNVGGRSRTKYTIVGDAVNVGSRVEGLNKELGTTILITEATFSILAGRVKARDCGPLAVKGRHEPVRVFELQGVAAAP